MPYRRLARILADNGFRPVGQRGSHVKWRGPDGRHVIVPHHAGAAVDAGLVRAILRQAGLDPQAFRR